MLRSPRIFALALLALAAGGVLMNTVQADPLTETTVRFIAMGDFGQANADQYAVAEAIEQVCAQRGCDFATSLGDNIYDIGALHPYDPVFEENFELPYAGVDFPWYMTLGNHDNGAVGQFTQLGDNEVAYSQRTDRMSEKWTMPDRFYTHRHGDVEFYAYDSDTIDDAYNPLHPGLATGAQQQAFFQDAIRNSTSTWKIAHAHYPYVSNGDHGDGTASYQAAIRATFCDKVDLILVGHDHDMQWLEPVPSCGTTEFVVSGAGGGGLYPVDGHNPYYFQNDTDHGFFWVEITGNTLRGVFFDVNGEVLFERTISK